MNLFILFFRCFIYQPLLIEHFGDLICFTYPKQKNKSQMFFSADTISTDLAETCKVMPSQNPCQKVVNFNLEGSFNSAEDININYSEYTNNRPEDVSLLSKL